MSTYNAYQIAKEMYAAIGVDTDAAIAKAAKVPVSIQCWQGDDVIGFENAGGTLSGGIQTTGNYPGRARTIDELRADFEKVMTLVPGTKRLSLHSIYLDSDKPVERNMHAPEHFDSWIDWAKNVGIKLDFNPTCFSHPLSADGFTLSHHDETIRRYWIDHVIASRRIGEYIGKKLNDRVLNNIWVPDGFKDTPVDLYGYRARLADSLDTIFAETKDVDDNYIGDGLESKVFGIGVESATIGSNEFYVAYAAKSGRMPTFDTGHYHPTEVVSDKIPAAMVFFKEIMLHVSRPVRWDSDHVVIFDDELKKIASEIVRNGFEDRVHIGLDYFDASINRVGAWATGARSMQKALLYAYLEPTAQMKQMELEGDYTGRLIMLEELKSMPFSAVWNMYCEQQGIPADYLAEVKKYEAEVTSKR